MAGPGENALVVTVAGLDSIVTTSNAIDSARAVRYQLIGISPSFAFPYDEMLMLQFGWFFATLTCRAPATCTYSGAGAALRADSTLELDYANSPWSNFTGGGDQRQIGVIHADTLIINRDEELPPYSFKFAFHCVSRPAVPCT